MAHEAEFPAHTLDCAPGSPADLIVAGVPVHGAPGAAPGSDAVAVRGERILAVGPQASVLALAGPQTRILRPARGCVTPGLVDGHAHLDREGLKDIWPSLDGAADKAAVQARIAEIASRTPPGEWIVTMPLGGGPSYAGLDRFLKEGLPTRRELDEAAPDNPVYIRPIWGYWRPRPPLVSIANSRALALAGIGRDTPSPAPEVTIVRDLRSGEPNGVFLEDAIMPIVELTLMACAPHFTPGQRVAALARSMRVYNGFATTTVYEGHGAADALIEAYRALAGGLGGDLGGDLGDGAGHSVRARLTISPSWTRQNPADAAALARDWAGSIARRSGAAGLMSVAGLYAEIDEERQHWLRARAAPQTGWAGFHYDCGLPREELKAVLVEAARNRMQVSCIAANVAPLFAEVDKIAPIGGLRWAWGHIGVIDDDDIARMRDLGLVAVTHTNRHIAREASLHKARLGAELADRISPVRKLLEGGVPVALASDNAPPSLWGPVSHVVCRRDGFTGEVVAPSQKLDRAEALHCATWNGAYLCGMEDEVGSIEPGKLADLAILDRDYMAVPDREIAEIAADMTIVGGRTVFSRAGDL